MNVSKKVYCPTCGMALRATAELSKAYDTAIVPVTCDWDNGGDFAENDGKGHCNTQFVVSLGIEVVLNRTFV